jgi:hypothetical protein
MYKKNYTLLKSKKFDAFRKLSFANDRLCKIKIASALVIDQRTSYLYLFRLKDNYVYFM